MPVKAYNFVGKVEKYYTLLQQIYKIIYNEFRNISIKVSL
jgi:hypothetical protein